MHDVHVRRVEFRLSPPSDLAKRCEDANRELLKVQWLLEDADRDERFIDFDEAHDWAKVLRSANAALALAAVAFASLAQSVPQTGVSE